MERFLLLFSSIVSVFVLSWGLSRWFGPQNCINSTIVGKVIIESDRSLTRECTPYSRLFDGQPHPTVIANHLFKRLESLEITAPYLNSAEEKLTLVISQAERQTLDIGMHTIQIGQDLLTEGGVLERAILVSSLNNGYTLAAEVAADFLWEEILNASPVASIKSWRAHLQSLTSYCLSHARLLMHHNFCRAQIELSDSYITSADEEPVLWSLAPALTQTLRDIYRNSSFSEKKHILDNLVFLGDIDSLWLESVVKESNISKYENIFMQMAMGWLSPVVADDAKLKNALINRLAQSNAAYNYVMVGRTSRIVFPLDFNYDENIQSKERLVIQLGSGKYFHPGDVSYMLARNEVIENLNINHFIYVSCEMPEVESLLEFENYTNKIIFVRQCDTTDVDWTAVSNKGLMFYLTHNPDIEFVEFNLSALKLAKRVRGPLNNKEKFESWQKWLLWSNSVLDEGVEVKRPLSAIDGVQRYRIY